MSSRSGGAPRRRGTVKKHTTQRLELADKTWLEGQAKAAGISVPDAIHGLCEAARQPGSDAEKLAAMAARVVFLENQLYTKTLDGRKLLLALQAAQEKNFQLAQRLRAQHGAFAALSPEVQRSLPERFLAKNREVFQQNAVKEEDRVVVF